MSWYLLKNDGTVYGPVEWPELQEWAGDGRIAPEDSLSQDRRSWKSAPSYADLRMEWLVELDDGSRYGPIHLMALREMQQEGSLSPATRILHARTQEITTLGEALKAAAPATPTPTPAPAPAPKVVAPAPVAPSATEEKPASAKAPTRMEWKEIARSKDHFEREAVKWRKMYEEERERAERTEKTADERVEALRKNELASTLTIEQLQRTIGQLEKKAALMEQTLAATDSNGQSAQILALIQSYQELSERYDNLVQQLTSKSQEIQSVLESRAQAEKYAAEQVRRTEEVVQREREESDLARRRATELEQSHLDLVRAYRELNDRFIRFRNAPAEPAAQADNKAGSESKVALKRPHR